MISFSKLKSSTTKLIRKHIGRLHSVVLDEVYADHVKQIEARVEKAGREGDTPQHYYRWTDELFRLRTGRMIVKKSPLFLSFIAIIISIVF